MFKLLCKSFTHVPLILPIGFLGLSITLSLLSINSYAESVSQNLDPTKPLAGSQQEINIQLSKNLTLEGIFHGSQGGETHTVIINGQTLKVNDMVGEYKLVAVNDDSVILRSSEKRLKLNVFSSSIIKTTKSHITTKEINE